MIYNVFCQQLLRGRRCSSSRSIKKWAEIACLRLNAAISSATVLTVTVLQSTLLNQRKYNTVKRFSLVTQKAKTSFVLHYCNNLLHLCNTCVTSLCNAIVLYKSYRYEICYTRTPEIGWFRKIAIKKI
jgi:hypothetical protein